MVAAAARAARPPPAPSVPHRLDAMPSARSTPEARRAARDARASAARSTSPAMRGGPVSSPSYVDPASSAFASYSAMVCSADDLASVSPPAEPLMSSMAAAPIVMPSTGTRPAAAPRPAPRTSAAVTTRDSDAMSADGATPADGAAAGSATAPAPAGTDAAAASGGPTPAHGGSGGAAATGGGRRAPTREQTPQAEPPFVPLPIPQPANDEVQLSRQPLERTPAPPPLGMPRALSVIPDGGIEEMSPAVRRYPIAFEEAAAGAARSYDEVVAAGRNEHEQLRSLYADLQADAQRQLDESLNVLRDTLADARSDLDQAESDAVFRLGLQADNARAMIRVAARRAMGTVAARRAAIQARMTAAREAAQAVEVTLGDYLTAVDVAGAAASAAFSGLQADPSRGHAPNTAADYRDQAPQMQAAENEDIDVAIPVRAGNRATAFTDGAAVFADNLNTAHTNFQNAATQAFQPFQNYVDRLGQAPAQIARMRDNAIKQVDSTERNSADGVRRSRNSIEIGLVERHRRSREQIVSQSTRAAEAQRTSVARAAESQWKGFTSLASGQGAAILALHEQIAAQRAQPPDNFARFVIESGERTRRLQREAVIARLGQSAGAAERMRRQFTTRGAQIAAGADKGIAQLNGQLRESARGSGAQMFAQILALDQSLRRMADPVAQSIDNFPIPAKAELDTMENALWSALREAQAQAVAAYMGTPGPASSGEANASTPPPASTSAQPPAGTGSSPKEFVDLSDDYTAAPESEQQIFDLTRSIAETVVGDVTRRGDGLMTQMTLLGQNPEQTIDLVRGLTYLRGQAVIKYYNEVRPGNLWDDIATYMSFGNLLTGVSTRIYSGDAVYNYLLGNRAAGALAEIQAATEWTNNADQVQAAMTSLSPADMAAMRGLPGAAEIMDSVENDLEGADRRMFQLLRTADETNAADRVAAARAVRAEAAVTTALDENATRGGDNAFDAMERFARQAGTSRLEGAREFNLTATGEFESAEAGEARRRAAWANTVSRLGNDGAVRADGAAGGEAWLRELASRERTYSDGDYVYTASLRPEQVDLLTTLARTGPGTADTRAMQLAVEDSRPGGANRERVERALDDPELNDDMGNPDDPNSRMSHPRDPAAEPSRLERAQAREAEMYRIWDRYRNGGRDSGRTLTEIRADLGGRLRRGASDEREGRLIESQVTRGLTDPTVAALAFEHAVDRWGTDESLLRSTFGRMSRDQIQAAVAEYDRTHTPGLYERLGLFEHSDDYFTELSGDDRIEMQVLAMGQPRNPRERAEVSRMTSRLQLDNAGWAGQLLAREEYRRLEASHNRLMRAMGVSEGDADHVSDFDARGNLRFRNRDGVMVRAGRFDDRGNFTPAEGDSVVGFSALMATNQANAQAYRTATDNIANAITTALVVAAAVLSTALTGGAAASFWIPVLTTLGAGVLGMAASWAIKGGRYGYEDAGRDFGLAVVQAATAGLASGLNIARAGGMGALRGALGSRLISTAGFRTVTLAEEVVIGGAAGAFSGAGTAAFDDRAWDRGEWLANIGRGAERGFGGGMASSLATGLTSRAVSLGAGGLGRLSGTSEALRRGRVGDVATRFGAMRGQAWSESFGTRLLGRTLGGGIGNAASRWSEINYDRHQGRYEGTSAQAADEIWGAAAQGGIQSFLEGTFEHGADSSARLQRWREAGMPPEGMPGGRPPSRAPPEEAGVHPPSRAPPGEEAGMHPPSRAPPEEQQGAPARRRSAAPEEELAVRTMDDDGRAPRRAVAANDNPLVATHVRIDLSTADPNLIGRVTEGTVIVHPDPTNYAGAEANFRRLLAADPTREAAIYHNPDTNEYVVIQGGPKAVTAIRPDGEMTGVGAQGRMVGQGGLVRGQRPWILQEHFHPNRPGESGTRLSRRMPSAIGGDMQVVLVESQIMGFGARSSRIHFDDNGTPNFTDFGVAPGHPKGPLWVNYPDPVTGVRVTEHFATLGDYHRAMVKLTGDETRAAAGGTAVRTADHDAPDPAGPRRALERGSTETALTDADRPVIRALGEQLGLNDQQRMHLASLRAAGSTDPEIAHASTRLAASEDQSRRMVRDLGLVGEPDSMARLHLVMNDLSLSIEVRQILVDTVVAATREHMIAMGTLAHDEPLMLLLHGTPQGRAGSIREAGVQMSRITGGGEDDFGRGFYLTTRVRAAETYATKGGVPRGEIFPFMVRGRDFGPTVDVRPGGAHRALWERFVMANTHLFGDVLPFRGAGMPLAMPEGGGLPFGMLDAFGNRGRVFEAFLEHLAARTGRPELGAPHLVLGELGGPMTSGYGSGDQQAVRHQGIADLFNAQMGFRRGGAAADADAGGLAVRTADEVPPVTKPGADETPANAPPPVADTVTPADLTPVPTGGVEIHHIVDPGPIAQSAQGRAAQALDMVVDMIPNKAQAAVVRALINAMPSDHHALIREYLTAGTLAERQQIVQRIRAEIRARSNSTEFEHVAQRLNYLREVIGPQFRQTLDNINALHAAGLPVDLPGLHPYLLESPLVLHMWRSERALIEAQFALYAARAGAKSSAGFESFIEQQFRTGGLDPAARQRLGILFPWLVSGKSRSKAAAIPVAGIGQGMADEIGYAPGDRVASGDVPYGPHFNPFDPSRTPLKPGDAMVPGMRVDHPVNGRGTLIEVHGGIAVIRYDGLPDARVLTPLAHGMVFPARDLMGGGDVPVVPLLSGGPLDTEMARITQFRDENDLPEYDRGSKTGTVAVARVGDDHFYGTNSTMPTERTTMTAADIQAMRAIMHALGFADPTASQNTQQHFTHAEFAALYAASLRRGTMPEVVELFVDRDTCESCQNHLDRLAGYFGIKELRVYFFNAPPPQPVIYKGRGR
ncbi:hypothetical protein MZO42_16195 [Sphingomonas psychrotolerans]|uniref:Uncharacterized protein n=1 Tax=Sphingomonas psychrotolerans TaxID=1327635 RepID=A0ABU3N6T0_9SPHN|nr:hypothetical protein [Sphingomonas psychrotolerans]MDT8760242.1 hypothetical protein [Sphingomonas psychrotolerans]